MAPVSRKDRDRWDQSLATEQRIPRTQLVLLRPFDAFALQPAVHRDAADTRSEQEREKDEQEKLHGNDARTGDRVPASHSSTLLRKKSSDVRTVCFRHKLIIIGSLGSREKYLTNTQNTAEITSNLTAEKWTNTQVNAVFEALPRRPVPGG
jgi:hypothetical protein